MNFLFETNVTKELILSKISEEQIMEFYLKIPLKKGLFRSVLRTDKNPTCSIFRNRNGNLIYKDFATGQHLNCFGVVQTLFNCDYHKALKIIANDFNIVPNSNIERNEGRINLNPTKFKKSDFSRIQVEIKEFSDNELSWWLKHGITKDILNKFNVYSCKHVFLNGNLFAKSQESCPIYGYYNGKNQKDGIKYELWKCYFPKRKEYRFIGNYPANMMQGYKQLPKTGKLCVITKSLKDVMTLYSLGISAIAPNSETIIPDESIINELKSRFENVIFLWDLDSTGISFSKKIKKRYPELTVTLLPRVDRCKDISDYYKTYGRKKTVEMIYNKINRFKKLIKNEK